MSNAHKDFDKAVIVEGVRKTFGEVVPCTRSASTSVAVR